MYIDKSLEGQVVLAGYQIANDGDFYIGAYPHDDQGIADLGIDNLQIFNKALTLDEITILALVNKDVITD